VERDKRKRQDELDRFWEIDDLLPKRRAPHYPSDTEATEIELPRVTKKPNASATPTQKEPIPPREQPPKTHFIPPHGPEEEALRPRPMLEYTPDNALIRCVRIYPWKIDYRYYEGFLRDAVRLYGVRGESCQRVPFFSYSPQYTQMNRAQLEWYLWWRELARGGDYTDTDYSYVLLYVYEIINLSGVMDAAESQRRLCEIWLRYRSIYRQLDSYLPNWICDYSLIHRLPPPDESLGIVLSDVMPHATLKEFFVQSGGKNGYLTALLAFCSNYDYRKSKFYTKENAALFDRVIPDAVERVTHRLTCDGKLFANSGMDDSSMMRDAYAGALCAYRNKRRIEVQYCSFSRSHELRFLITDVVKYTENKIRAVLGVRSRLSVYALPTALRELLDGFCEESLPKRATTSKNTDTAPAEYERLYDLPRTELSLSHAASIERASWETTERLVEAFEEDSDSVATEAEAPPTPIPAAFVPQGDAESSDEWQKYRDYLLAALSDDVGAQREAARKTGLPEEVLTDEINTLAADLLGDILLEENENGFAVIEDYRDTVQAIAQKL